MENKISLDIAATVLTNVNTAIGTIKTNLPFLLTLTPEDRIKMLKMGDKSLAFVRKAYEYGKLNPSLVPSYISLEEMRKDIEASEKLHAIYSQLNDLVSRLDDTIMVASSEALNAALGIYSSAQAAAKNNVPGAKGVVEDLQTRFLLKNKPKTTKAHETTK